MPELPDLAILADAFDAALGGRPVTAFAASDPLVLRATPSEAADIVGDLVRSVGRRGKHLVFRMDRHELWAAPMLTGRFALVAPGSPRPKAAVSMTLGPRVARRARPVPWVARAPWLPASGDPTELRYIDPTRMGKLYVVAAGGGTTVPGVAALGPDADDPDLTVDVWRARIRRHPGELKALLRNQAFVAGLGNAYSDEVLWAAGLNPFRRRSALAEEEVDALHAALQATLSSAAEVLRLRVPPTFEKQVRDHLQVHLRGGAPCPRCGGAISQVGRREATSFCRACQR